MSRYTNIFYIGRYLVLTYIERFISAVYFFFGHICWSVNCMSWVCKFNIFLWHVRKLRQDLHLRALILSFMESSFLTPWYFFCFFYRVCKLFKGLFQSFSQSVNCMNWVFELWNMPRRCHVMSALICIWDLVVLLFMKSSICIVCTISGFSGL